MGYAACALAGTFWGTGFFFGKIAFSQLDVGHFVLYRFLFACAGMLPIMRAPCFSRREWKLLLTASFLGIPLQFMIQFYGLKLTTVSHAALMVGTMPVILAIGARVFTHERLDLKGWLALLGSTAGVALIAVSASHGVIGGGNLRGDLLVVISLIIALAWVLLNRHLMALGRSPLAVTGWGILTGTGMLAVWVLLTNGPPPIRGIHVQVWLAVADTLGVGRVQRDDAGLRLHAGLLWRSGSNPSLEAFAARENSDLPAGFHLPATTAMVADALATSSRRSPSTA